MDQKLNSQLMLYLERGKNQITFEEPIQFIVYGRGLLKKYAETPPLTKKITSSLNFVQNHRDNYIELAGLILELEGWLITHPEPSQIKLMVKKRVSDLKVFNLHLLDDLTIIENRMVTIEGIIEDNVMVLNNASQIAKDLIPKVQEVLSFLSKDFASM